MNRWTLSSPDEDAKREARSRWNSVAKPLDSLGEMENLITQAAGIQGTADVTLSPRCALVFCADHGVVAEGVTQSDGSVTALVARSIAEGEANINLMAKPVGADVFAIDIGMLEEIEHSNMIVCKEARGTANMAHGPAMTRAQAERAMAHGINLVGEMKRRGYRAVATGEMGIGNTTAAAAMASVLLNQPVHTITGRGAGLSDAGLERKVRTIERAITINQPDASEPLDVLAKVGGYEIAGMAGAFLGGMTHRVPVVIDGVISAVAALLAFRLCPGAKEFMLPSHISKEPAARLVMDALGLSPVIHAGMALGEGTGAVMLFPLLDMALQVYQGTHTFCELGMEAYTPQGGMA